MNNYYYKQTEPGLWTVGTGKGKNWEAESDHASPYEAASRVNFLHGGGTTSTLEEVKKEGRETEQYKIFQVAFILHKYFIKGNMRPIENFASMIVDLANKQDYEDNGDDVAALVEKIKSELDKQYAQFKNAKAQLAEIFNRGAEKGEAIKEFVMTEKTREFIHWVRENKNPLFEFRQEQVDVLDRYFSLLRGEGKTDLINLLKEYDR